MIGLIWFAVTMLAVFVVASAIILFVRWYRRRQYLSALARDLGIVRKRAESDAALRARCAQLMRPATGPTKARIGQIADDLARRYGCRATVTVDNANGLISVGVRGGPSRKGVVLDAIERDLGEHLPMTVAVEVFAAR